MYIIILQSEIIGRKSPIFIKKMYLFSFERKRNKIEHKVREILF